jgi:hypothetical protein
MRFIGNKDSKYLPPKGTIGVVMDVCTLDSNDEGLLLMQWPEGTTCDDDMWYVGTKFVEPVDS